uniref:Phospholipase n=1 Tax=Ditylenchus dipsaci TaxID=166011 RepID=A0A915ED17_9BILA
MEKGEKKDHVHDNACDCDGGGDDSPKSPRRRKGYIPYGTVYESQDELRKQGYWIPGISVDAKIVAVEKDTSSQYHILNPFLYTIQLEHGKYKWSVVRRYKDFSYLSQRLMAHRAVERIKSPIRRVKNRLGEAIDKDDDSDKEKDSSKLPTSSNYQLKTLKKATEIGDYGRAGAGRNSTYDNYDEEDDIEHIDGNRPEEKREPSDDPRALPSFPMRPDSLVQPVHMEERRHQLETWLQAVLAIPINRDYHETAEFLEVSRFSFINELGNSEYAYIKLQVADGEGLLHLLHEPSSEQIRLVLFFDEQFEINSPEFGLTFRPKELFLSNLSHVLNIKCSREEDSQYWIKIIKRVIEETGQSYCQWFVDAKEYWDKASAMIEMAREEIFIADWWLCPEIYLRRPMAEGNHWRLDYVLKRQAEKGVRIFILIYKEMEMAIGLNSLYSKRHLQNLHPNIKVMRHPDHYVGTGTFFWAHHEKLLIIDQLIAFVGGLDLCYGRWDDSRHVLTDLGSVQLSPRSEQYTVENTSKGGNPIMHSIKHATDKCHLDVNKSGFNEKQEVHRVTEDIIEKGEKIGTKVTTTIQAIPEDEAMHKVMGRIKGGRSRETTPASESLNAHPLYGQGGSDGIESMEKTSEGGKPMIKFRSVTAIGEQHPDATAHNGLHMKPTLLPMEPSTRTLMRRVVSNLRPSKTKRRWRMALDQEDTAEEYVINYCRFQETTVDMSGLQGAGKLWPGKDYARYSFNSVRSAARDVARHFIQRWNATKTEKLKSNDDYPYLLPKSYNASVEISVHWSTLIDKNEDSIQQAYLSLISNARHYIYIENQFFVSMIKSVDVTNAIAQVLCDRIVKAHKNDETFRVFVMIPLLPGFEGDISSTSYSALLAVLHWTLLSISKANINDRSQAGNRDSEVCLLIKDHEFVPSTMNGEPYEAGKFAYSLRKRLMEEHLGLMEDSHHKADPGYQISVDDPIVDAFYNDIWREVANENTRIFEEVFRCYPTNLVETFQELTVWRGEIPMSQSEPDEARQKLKDSWAI